MIHLESEDGVRTEDVFHVSPVFADQALVNARRYRLMCNHAATSPDAFWLEQAARLDWVAPPSLADGSSFERPVRVSWFADGTLNASVSCLDRHLAERGDSPALIWLGDEEGRERVLTWRALHEAVCRAGNALRRLGVERGDRVAIYMPMVPEAAVAMLACARIGAVHAVMFAGFAPESVSRRLVDCGATVLVTADEVRRGGRRLPLKAQADQALEAAPGVRRAIVLRTGDAPVAMRDGRDLDWAALMAAEPAECAPETMSAEDPLFVLYTSGSTGAPKGLVHATGGYLVWASFTHEIVFDVRPGAVFWCTADIGWITGHSYLVYGPLCNGVTTVMMEGVPTHPDPGRCWRAIDRHRVEVFYTAPTAIRALMKFGDAPLEGTDRSSLRVIGSVGEPINPEAWHWYHRAVGRERCPVVDTWWQTETGGIMISPLPGATALKPGSATRPLPGVAPMLVGPDGAAIEGEGEGQLLIERAWPGLARTIHGDHERFEQTYFTAHPGRYTSGDGARRDAEGDYWITGRVDDVINVSGHRIGSAEVEAALGRHEAVAESAVIGVPHEVKGQAVFAFVVLRDGHASGEGIEEALRQTVRRGLGAYAIPDGIQLAPDLPKTRSGKIMRRILRKIATGETDQLGDVSTLADPGVVDALIAARAGAAGA